MLFKNIYTNTMSATLMFRSPMSSVGSLTRIRSLLSHFEDNLKKKFSDKEATFIGSEIGLSPQASNFLSSMEHVCKQCDLPIKSYYFIFENQSENKSALYFALPKWMTVWGVKSDSSIEQITASSERNRLHTFHGECPDYKTIAFTLRGVLPKVLSLGLSPGDSTSVIMPLSVGGVHCLTLESP